MPTCFIVIQGKKLKSKDLGDDDVEAGEISEEEDDDFDDDEGNNVTGTSESVRVSNDRYKKEDLGCIYLLLTVKRRGRI